jgi:hypothetical protein
LPRIFPLVLTLTLAAAPAARADEAPSSSLRGSPASMVRQNRVAKENDYSFLRDAAEVRRMAENGFLVRMEGNVDYRMAKVSHPYARPVVETFVERLAGQYRDACDERLVVTSLTRPLSGQPRNAHDLSVHPAGMAVDLRISRKAECRAWLEETLLSLEKHGLLDVTREKSPPHYHVAVFPDAYGAYVSRLREAAEEPIEPAAETRKRDGRLAAKPRVGPVTLAAIPSPTPALARVRLGDDDRGAWAALLAFGLVVLLSGAIKRQVRSGRAG